MKILLTGATGFLGQALLKVLHEQDEYSVIAAVRSPADAIPLQVQQFVTGDLRDLTDWSAALTSVDIVVHAAARAHIMNDTATDPLEEFRQVNAKSTLLLARQASEAGVKRFVYISSIKVNGESTQRKPPFSPDDTFITSDPYGISKREAEEGLFALSKATGMEVVIIRPPLVYGPGVKANFLSLMKLSKSGLPLPFGAIHNQRSFVAIDNLVDFIVTCIAHPKAANEVFLISDGHDVSTTELLRKMANAFGKKILLLPVPTAWMSWVLKLLGKENIAERLFGSLRVDSSKARKLLGWKPIVTMDEQLKETARILK
ncbi:MAG: UDP-glucose 4-epimerase [Zetaproteobacteria bacterium CG2_30_46_52]|nr:MAG: UDP-glucose 4-epimerase [Zetaproteobacteria bacterium CG2_30_46_52]